MTEYNRDILEGTTVEERDLEGYVNQKSDLDDYVRERNGLPNPEVIIDVEALKPYRITQPPADDVVADLEQGDKIVNITDLRPTDSGFAKHLWGTRPQNKKRAA